MGDKAKSTTGIFFLKGKLLLLRNLTQLLVIGVVGTEKQA